MGRLNKQSDQQADLLTNGQMNGDRRLIKQNKSFLPKAAFELSDSGNQRHSAKGAIDVMGQKLDNGQSITNL